MTQNRTGTEASPEDRLRRLDEPFRKMFQAEVSEWISKLPKHQGCEFGDDVRPDPRNGLVGIAMSGGGMRSATYNLGVAQALARCGLMEEADYISTVSGGGYFGSSLTSLCAEDLPYNENWDERLDMSKGRFPYAFPGPLTGDQTSRSTSVHALESPATRHVREHSNLLAPALGLFQTEMWTALSRYLASTVLLWVLFLLPSVTGIFLLTMLIPDSVWVRFDPLGTSGVDSWAARNLWVWTIPAWFLIPVAVLAVFSPEGRGGEEFAPRWVRRLQRFFLMLAGITGGAVVFALAVWGFTFALNNEDFDQLVQGILGAMGVGGGAAAGAGARKMMVPKDAQRALFKVLFSLGGFIILGVGLVVWYYFLLDRIARPQLDTSMIEGVGIYWGAWGLAWDGVILAFVITAIWGPRLLNRLSLHHLYERRIQRTWVMGAKPQYPPGSQGVPNPAHGWSRVWVRPDIRMRDLKTRRATAPYHLICTTLNIPGSTGPKLLDRKADSFVIGAVYSGSALTRWEPTESLKDIADMPLARAATISAAAVSPNMGEKTSTTLSIVTTLFNLRLGWWVANPRETTLLRRLLVLVPWTLYWKELLGHASHKDALVYLSDGGHFENLGVYELLRRRCKYIIAVDGTGEPPDPNTELNFGGLGIPLRRARIDFGVEVDIDLRPLMRDGEGKVESHFAVGHIRYPKDVGHGSGQPEDADSGIFVLIKAGRVDKDLTPDIINYRRQVNDSFPHDTTADQQFDSQQFESYRQLGYLAGSAVCKAVGDEENTAAKFQRLDNKYCEILTSFESPGG